MSTPPKILVVDDEANIRLFLEEILSQDGYEIITAESGEVAVGYIAEQLFDLALIDLKMPGIDGIEVLKTVREKSTKTVIIVLTAHASLESAIEALRSGAHDYLFKPCKPNQLRDTVQRGLFNRQTRDHQRDLIYQLKEMSRNLENIRNSITVDQPSVSSAASESTATRTRFLERAGLTVDLLQHIVILDGQQLETTPTEFNLLTYLLREAPRAIPPQELIQNVQGYETETWEASGIVRRHIHRLRQKIKKIRGDSNLISTIRGVGYAIGENG